MSTTLANPASKFATSSAGKYLTFALGNESYGVNVLQVREIIRLQPFTPVPQMPAHIKGVLNLRGKIVPVLDLRTKFGFTEICDNEHTCIVVVQIGAGAPGGLTTGLVVDAVEEVVQIGAEDIEPAPDFGAGVDTQYILGMAKIKGAVKVFIHIDKVVSLETIDLIKHASARA
jgi:purine-binding chemotaxis protein CheW